MLESEGASARLPLTLPRVVGWAAQRYGNKVALREDGHSLSYIQLNDLRRQAAKAFMVSGIQAGDRVAIWAPNISEWIVAATGLQSVGAVLVPLNTRLQAVEAADILRRARVNTLLTVEVMDGRSPLATLAAQDLPELTRRILLRGDAEGGIPWREFLAGAEQVDAAAFVAAERAVNPDDTADMLFTSGTTGQAKGVLSSHCQNIRVFQTWSETVGLRQDDNYLIVNPFFHSFGYKAGWLAAIIAGATIVPMAVFDKEAVFATIAREKITMLPGAPSLYQMLISDPECQHYDLSSLRLGVTGAATVPVKLVQDMRQILGFETVVTAYGLTESTGVVSICRPEDSAETIANTCGRAIDGVEVSCVDPASGKPVSIGFEGEVWVRGYNVMQGYFDMPEATAQAITPEGWLRTGDIGVLDERGYLRITDRLKDMYIMNGENVYPAEVEKVIQELEEVAQVAVIGVPRPPQGEVGMAFVVKKADAVLDEETVRNYCRQKLARYKQPFYITFVDALPMNPSGKVVKNALRQQVAKDSPRERQ